MAAYFGNAVGQQRNNGQVAEGPYLEIISALPPTARFVYNTDSDRGHGWIYHQDQNAPAKRRAASNGGIQVKVGGSCSLPEKINIRCSLISELPDKPHTHQLLEKPSKETNDWVEAVAQAPNWIAIFKPIAICTTVQKEGLEAITRRLDQQWSSRQSMTESERQEQAKGVLRGVKHDTVIMKFEAFINEQHVEKFSDPIKTSRKEMEIVEVFYPSGICTGGQDVQLWVDGNVKKDQVSVVFEAKDGPWTATAKPHRYHKGAALIFKTPAYTGPFVTEKVEVSFWLQNLTNEKNVSNPYPFTYLVPSVSVEGNPQKRSRTTFEESPQSQYCPAGPSTSNESSNQGNWNPPMEQPARSSAFGCEAGANPTTFPFMATPSGSSDNSNPGNLGRPTPQPINFGELNQILVCLQQSDNGQVQSLPTTTANIDYSAGYGDFLDSSYSQNLGCQVYYPMEQAQSAPAAASSANYGQVQSLAPMTANIDYSGLQSWNAGYGGFQDPTYNSQYRGCQVYYPTEQAQSAPAAAPSANNYVNPQPDDSASLLGVVPPPVSFDPDMFGDDGNEIYVADGDSRPTSAGSGPILSSTGLVDMLRAAAASDKYQADGPSIPAEPEKRSSHPDLASFQTKISEKLGRYAEFRDHLGRTILHLAVAEKLPAQRLEQLLAHVKLDINRKTYHGKTALHVAVEADHLEAVKVLLKHGANAELAEHQQGNTPAHLAAQLRNQTLFDFFQAKADEEGGYGMDKERYDGLTPLEVWEMNDGDSSGTASESDDDENGSGDGEEPIMAGLQNLAIREDVGEEQ